MIQNVAPLASIAAALVSGVAYVLTGNGSSVVARVGRWLALDANGRPHLARLGIGAAVAAVSMFVVVITPTLRIAEVTGDVERRPAGGQPTSRMKESPKVCIGKPAGLSDRATRTTRCDSSYESSPSIR